MNLKNMWQTMNLVDKFLFILMIMLLLQSAYNLFCPGIVAGQNDPIDITLRTSAAAIFGYFLSSSFMKKNNESVTVDNSKFIDVANNESSMRNQIGFDTVVDGQSLQKGVAANHGTASEQFHCSNLQVLVVACISIFCLVILLLAYDMVASIKADDTTVSQLRDFISGGIGFLIGCGKNK